MKKQVVFIHGGQAYSNHDDYLDMLRTTEVEDPFVDVESPKKWKYTLREELGDAYEVGLPQMPSPNNAKYQEWKIWFERLIPFLRDGVILIGYSQGGYFLLKYFSENEFPHKTKALFLIAAPFGADDFGGEDGGDFEPDPDLLPNIQDRVEQIFVCHSKDDAIVPYAHAMKTCAALPPPPPPTFEDRGHFFQEEFPELIADIRSL